MSKSKVIAVGVLLSVICAFPFVVSADHRQDVLGDSTSSTIVFPAVTDGPGFILPDSPFYVVDKIFQKLKLTVAVSPEKKVQTRMLLIGERVAEVRAEMVRENTSATQVALDELRNESENLSYDLKDADGQGKDIKDLAKDVNDRLQLHREFLASVAGQVDNALSLELTAAGQSLLVTKMTAEDYLQEEFLAQAMIDDLEGEIDRDVLGVETTTIKLERKLDKLDLHASRSAAKQEYKASKKDAKDQRAKALEEYKARMEKLKEERKQRMQEAKEAAKKAKEAIKRLREIRREEKQGSNVTPTPTPQV